LNGFKAFVLRGNVVDLAVGIIIGAAFGTVVQALVRDLIAPIIAAAFGKPDFSTLYVKLGAGKFAYGDFLNALIAFVIVAAVVYYFVVVPYARLRARFEPPPVPLPVTRACPECLSQIPEQAHRCAFCTSVVEG